MAKEIQISGPVTTILAELDRSAAADTANARRRSRAGWGIAASIVGLIIGFVCAVPLPPLGGILIMLAPVALIVSLVCYIRCRRRDFEDRKRDIARQFFAVLAQDIPRQARCQVRLNGDGFEKHGQVVEQTGGLLSSLKTISYEDPWGLLAGRLYDGSAFKVTLTQRVKRKSKAKRSYTKIRERHQEKVSLALRLDETTYPGLAQLPAQLQGSSVDGLNITQAEVAGNILRVAAVTGVVPRFRGRSGWSDFDAQGLVTGQRLLDLLVFIYSKLATVRGGSVQPS
jgi:hypothetical protein